MKKQATVPFEALTPGQRFLFDAYMAKTPACHFFPRQTGSTEVARQLADAGADLIFLRIEGWPANGMVPFGRITSHAVGLRVALVEIPVRKPSIEGHLLMVLPGGHTPPTILRYTEENWRKVLEPILFSWSGLHVVAGCDEDGPFVRQRHVGVGKSVLVDRCPAVPGFVGLEVHA